MGRTHEALERAEKEYERNFKVKVELPSIPNEFTQEGTTPPRITSQPNGGEVYEGLKVNLMARYPNKSLKSMVFCGTTHGDGATTTATNFAAVLAKDSQLKVLLVDVNLRTPGLHDWYQIDIAPGLSDYISTNNNPTCPTFTFKRKNFCILPSGSTKSSPIGLFDSTRFDQFLQEMREKFDYVILDAPPVPRFSESRVICPKVDGVILIVGSGKTRRQVAFKAKKELEDAGAKILGIIMNRRKYYVPAWIYKRI
jgi:protein-tyrosine kinase